MIHPSPSNAALFYQFAKESFTVGHLEQCGAILRERAPIPRSARVEPEGTATRLLESRSRHPELPKRIQGASSTCLVGRRRIGALRKANPEHEPIKLPKYRG